MRVARQGSPLRRPSDLILRIRGHQAAQDAFLTAIAIAQQPGSAVSSCARGAFSGQALPINRPPYEWLKAQTETAEGRKQIDDVQKLAAFAKTLGMPVHHLALLWCLANPNVSTVILGASKKSQLEDNLSALKDKGKLTPDVLAEMDAMLGNKPPVPERY
jgi:aryl-alcohol dehydrogenase-like predicted oxidoreductase